MPEQKISSTPRGGYSVPIDQLLQLTVDQGGSDMHLTMGVPPQARIHGDLTSFDLPPLYPEDIKGLLYRILSDQQVKQLEEKWELDLSYSITGLARFRGNIMYQKNSLSAVFRVVPFAVPEFEKLGIPPAVKSICDLTRGLVLVTGPTGSGKSTTLAALLNIINRDRSKNIVTIEDPIEFLHKHRKSTIRQREVGSDTHSFADALRHVLRHDPDVILIGEMRDLDSIAIALTAAETGHLVFSTLHTQTAPLTVSRIVDVFESYRREQVRQQLAGSLRAVVCQQLLPTADGKGRVPAVEFMVDTPAVRNMIREGKDRQLYSAIQTGRIQGMQTLDRSLSDLCKKGKITRETALEYCVDRSELERLLDGGPEKGERNSLWRD
ncbi:MAG TPA: type IV pili twitching motility protein PilT [Firmicutes bacterium]|nr:type IV pili twitching motility protein PilT [Bacillota bacterium]